MVSEAVIICGGTGSRLVNSGFRSPKSLISVDGEALLIRQLRFLIENGFSKVYLALGHGSQEILDCLASSTLTSKIEVIPNVEKTARGTGGALLALGDLIEDDIFVVYGDILFDIYMGRIIQGNRNLLATIITRRSNHLVDSDLVQVDYERNVTDFFAKPHSSEIKLRNIAATGMFLFSPKSIGILRKRFSDSPFNLERDGIKYLLEMELSIGTIPAVGLVQDLGTVERMRRADEIWRERFTAVSKRPAIFLDRDGTINFHRGHISSSDEFKVFEEVPESISRMRKLGFLVFVVTNQPVIARGEASWELLELIHLKLDEILEASNDTFVDEIFVCPHHPDFGFAGEIPSLKMECLCRKPRKGLIDRCLENYPIDLEKSWVVGDTWRDKELAKNSNINFAEVRTSEILNSDFLRFPTLAEFVDFIERETQIDHL